MTQGVGCAKDAFSPLNSGTFALATGMRDSLILCLVSLLGNKAMDSSLALTTGRRALLI
jgi:hypothetical protein